MAEEVSETTTAGPIYRLVHMSLWTDQKFRYLSPMKPSGQSLWIYLLIADREKCTIPGVIFAGIGTISDALSWGPRAVTRHLRELINQGMIIFDEESRVIFLPNAVKYNPPPNPSVVQGWGKSWSSIPEGPFRNRIHDTLLEAVRAKDAHRVEKDKIFVDAF